MRPLSLLSLLIVPILSAQVPVLSMEEAVTSALTSQPRLKAAEWQQQAIVARQQQAAWARVGNLDTTLTYLPRQKNQVIELPSFGSGLPAQPFEMIQARKYDVTINFAQPLWAWGALSNRHASAQKETTAGQGTLFRTRQQVVFETTRAFCQASQALEGVSVARRNLEQQNEFLRVATLRVEAGSAAKLDELKAKLAVAQAESALSETLNHERLARETLVSQTQDPRFRTSGLKPLEDEGSTLLDEEVAVALALGQRRDLKALQDQIQALDLSARAAKASGLPVLSFRASITQQNDLTSQLFRKDSQLYTAGLALTWEAFNPFRSRARATELKAMAQGTAQTLKSEESTVAQEVRTSLSSLKEARERLRVQQLASSVAEEQARVARLAYREGTLSAVEAQDAELALTNAHYFQLRAKLDAALAKASLRLALGE